MFTSAILDLRVEQNWEPARLTAEAFRWPSADWTHVVPIREIATHLSAKSFAEAGAPVITPRDIDRVTGAVKRRDRRFQGTVYQVGAELRSGDVVVPRSGLGPAVLITDALRGALLSGRFSAIRPAEPDIGLWLWAVLSSESGRRLRAGLSRSAAVLSIESRALLDAAIPMPPLAHIHGVSAELREIHGTTEVDEDEPVETWWTTADLRRTKWQVALATPDPSILTSGMPLAEYCGELAGGRPTRNLAIEEETPGYLPVADVSMIGGKPPRRWVPESRGNPRIALPGDLLVASLGKFPHAWVVDRPVAVDAHVLLLRLRNPSSGPALAHYLNGQAGFQIRQLFLTGTSIPRISGSDLGRIPVPKSVLEKTIEPRPTGQLSDRLERALWRD